MCIRDRYKAVGELYGFPIKVVSERTLKEGLEFTDNRFVRQQGKNVSRAMLKGLEKRKHNLVAKLEKVEHAIKSRTDDVVDFKQMGIDHIFIDESHQFKNLTFNTQMCIRDRSKITIQRIISRNKKR